MVRVGPTGNALAGPPPSADPFDGLNRHVEEMRGDSGIATGQHGSGMVDALLDQISVPHGELAYGTIDDVSLGGVDECGEVPDPLLGALVDFDRCLAHLCKCIST